MPQKSRRASFALVCMAAALCACTRSKKAEHDTQSAPSAEAPSEAPSSAAVTGSAGSGDAVEAPPNSDAKTGEQKAPEEPALPSWARNPPQPKSPAALFARGIKGPIEGTFEGLLACKIVVKGTSWDPIIPFFGSASDGLPDIRVQHGDTIAVLPSDTSSGIVAFSGVTITKDSRVFMDVEDIDINPNDDIASVALDGSGGFPLEAKTDVMTLVCRGVPRAALEPDIKPHVAALDRALAAMEKSPPKVDINNPEAGRKGIETAKTAALELAAYIGFRDAIVASAIDRITAREAAYADRMTEAIDAAIAKTPKSEFQALPSARVRCSSTQAGRVEVEVGARPLKHHVAHKILGPLEFRYISRTGVVFTPTFETLYVDGKRAQGITATIPPKEKVEVELTASGFGDQPYAILVREGPKRAYLCLYTRR